MLLYAVPIICALFAFGLLRQDRIQASAMMLQYANDRLERLLEEKAPEITAPRLEPVTSFFDWRATDRNEEMTTILLDAAHAWTREKRADDEKTDDIWELEYVTDLYAASPDADGRLTRLGPAWFGAHGWSTNGKRILDAPDRVLYDGILYKRQETDSVKPDAKIKDLEKKYEGNLVLQTCREKDVFLVIYETKN